MTNDLTRAIDALVEQKTFSLDALEAIKALRDKAGELEKNAAAQATTITRLGEEVVEARRQNEAHLQRKGAIDKRETDVAARELKIGELEKSAAVTAAVSATWSACFDKLFANRIVRERLQTSVPIERQYPGGGNYVEQHHRTDDVTKQEG